MDAFSEGKRRRTHFFFKASTQPEIVSRASYCSLLSLRLWKPAVARCNAFVLSVMVATYWSLFRPCFPASYSFV